MMDWKYYKPMLLSKSEVPELEKHDQMGLNFFHWQIPLCSLRNIHNSPVTLVLSSTHLGPNFQVLALTQFLSTFSPDFFQSRLLPVLIQIWCSFCQVYVKFELKFDPILVQIWYNFSPDFVQF